MKRFVVFIVVIIMSLSLVRAVDNEDLAQQAETAYATEKFKIAVSLYQQLLEQGVNRSEIYFNLGNAYYELHDLGRSLVNYRRAEAIAPRDEDLRLNLARIRVQRLDGRFTDIGIAELIVNFTSQWLSPSELIWTVIVLWWLCWGLFAAYLWRITWQQWLRWAILASGVVFILVGVLILIHIIVDEARKPAIIVNDTVSVMSGPGTHYLKIFELHSAAEIRIVEERNHWVRFQLPDLREGWIEDQSLEVI
jgi:tetratricopeptide (TPR) repeat protein